MLQFLYPLQLGVLRDSFPVPIESLDPLPLAEKPQRSAGYQWSNGCVYYLGTSVCLTEEPLSIVELVTCDFRQGSQKRVRRSTVFLLLKDRRVLNLKQPSIRTTQATLFCRNARFIRQRTDKDMMLITGSGYVCWNGNFLPDRVVGGARSVSEYRDGYLILSLIGQVYFLNQRGLRVQGPSVIWFRQLSESSYAYTTVNDQSFYSDESGTQVQLDGVPRSSCTSPPVVWLLTYRETVYQLSANNFQPMKIVTCPGAIKLSMLPNQGWSFATPHLLYSNGRSSALIFE